MKSRLKLKILSIESFIEEVKSSKIDDVRAACFYKTMPSKEVMSLSYFYILVTAARRDGIVIEYEEETGGDISYFKEQIIELSKKTDKRKDEIAKQFEDAGIKVKSGRWLSE